MGAKGGEKAARKGQAKARARTAQNRRERQVAEAGRF
jgi:hypothetical protein